MAARSESGPAELIGLAAAIALFGMVATSIWAVALRSLRQHHHWIIATHNVCPACDCHGARSTVALIRDLDSAAWPPRQYPFETARLLSH
jgi:hypothetical protein